MSMQSLDIKRLSATTTTPPQVREPRSGEIAKLIALMFLLHIRSK